MDCTSLKIIMATKKITELSNLATPAGADILPIVDDVAGTATTKKVTATNLMTLAPVQSVNGSTGAVTVSGTDLFNDIVSETTTARTLSNSDNGKVIVCSNAGQIIVTIPSGLTSGFNCTITQGGAGTVTIAGSGASINGFNNKTATAGQYAVVNVIPVGANAYYVDGDLITAPLINNYSLDLDGVDDYMDTAANLTLQAASVWIKPDSTINSSSGAQVLMGGDSTNYRPLFLGNGTSYVTNEVVGVSYGLGAFGTGSGISLSNTSWHHIFIAWQTSSQSNGGSAGYDFWVNGTLQTTASGAQSGGTVPTSPMAIGSLDIGRRQNNTQFYAGLVDEIALWSTDVSGDIATIYNSGIPNNLNDSNNVSTAPTHWWRSGDNDGGTGTTITDQGSGSQDGTLTNGPTFSSSVPS